MEQGLLPGNVGTGGGGRNSERGDSGKPASPAQGFRPGCLHFQDFMVSFP